MLLLATLERSVQRFLRDFYRAQERYEQVDLDRLTGAEVHRLFLSFERDVLKPWGRMVVIEPAVGLSFGILDELTRRWLPQAPASFRFEVAKPTDAPESVEPATRLRRIARRVAQDPELTRLVTEVAPADVFRRLEEGGHQGLLAEIEEYIRDYGYRSFNELKLEEPDLREDPSGFFIMLRSALSFERTVAGDVGEEACDALLRELPPLRRVAYDRVRRVVRRSLAERESVRFARTRAFGTVKRLVRALGRDLVENGALDDAGDVFFLRLEELLGFYDGTGGTADLRPVVAARRREHEQHHRISLAPERFLSTGAPYAGPNLGAGSAWDETARSDVSVAAAGATLHGTPCSPGVVEGTAVVLSEPRDVNGGIVVAYRTDPGWVTALASATGLLIERGSPLTHVAIVAREMRIPTVVQIKDLTQRISTGTRLRLNGTTGCVDVR